MKDHTITKITMNDLVSFIDPMNQITVLDIDNNALLVVDDPYNDNIVDAVMNSDYANCEIIRIIPRAHNLVIIVSV